MLAEARQLEKCPCRSGDNFGQEARNVQCTILAAPWIQKRLQKIQKWDWKVGVAENSNSDRFIRFFILLLP